jgi:hypothetical protein
METIHHITVYHNPLELPISRTGRWSRGASILKRNGEAYHSRREVLGPHACGGQEQIHDTSTFLCDLFFSCIEKDSQRLSSNGYLIRILPQVSHSTIPSPASILRSAAEGCEVLHPLGSLTPKDREVALKARNSFIFLSI